MGEEEGEEVGVLVTKMGTISRCCHMGRGFVKKSAQFWSEGTYGMVNSSRETRSRIQLKR